MTINTYSQVWNLDVFFSGGSDSAELEKFFRQTEESIKEFEAKVTNWTPVNSVEDTQNLVELLRSLEEAAKRLTHAGAFIGCLLAQNTKDKKAYSLDAKITSLGAVFQSALGSLDHQLTTIDDSVWESVVATEPLKEFSFVLTESREKAKEKLSKEEEALIICRTREIGIAIINRIGFIPRRYRENTSRAMERAPL